MIGSRRRLSPQTVTIGLLNNMGDEALKITERQFAGLIDFAAGKTEIRLRIFVLEHIPRSPGALEYINGHCEPITAVLGEKLDGLIITGAQPRTVRLSDEPYWRELTEIIDWAKDHTTSTILSCLAAHAAVYHLDGIERRPLREKCFGLFPFRAHGDHSFGGQQGRGLSTPHSRYNEVLQSDLELAGYDILTSSPVHGADIFTKTFGSKFVFLQGHPEYDAKSLAREYRRDLSRYLRGDMEKPPAMPKGYFADEAEIELRGIERRAREDGRLSPAELCKSKRSRRRERHGERLLFHFIAIGSIPSQLRAAGAPRQATRRILSRPATAVPNASSFDAAAALGDGCRVERPRLRLARRPSNRRLDTTARLQDIHRCASHIAGALCGDAGSPLGNWLLKHGLVKTSFDSAL